MLSVVYVFSVVRKSPFEQIRQKNEWKSLWNVIRVNGTTFWLCPTGPIRYPRTEYAEICVGVAILLGNVRTLSCVTIRKRTELLQLSWEMSGSIYFYFFSILPPFVINLHSDWYCVCCFYLWAPNNTLLIETHEWLGESPALSNVVFDETRPSPRRSMISGHSVSFFCNSCWLLHKRRNRYVEYRVSLMLT